MNLWQSIQDLINLTRVVLVDYSTSGGLSNEGMDNVKACLQKMQDVVNVSAAGAAANTAVSVPLDPLFASIDPSPDPAIRAFLNAS